ncbi:MAG: sodium:solute symporter family protein [Candidatus Sumerlaeota bacterium]|nr:sodium:solute symporter family protein [Candidatus Sumerlaeota bacterium]
MPEIHSHFNWLLDGSIVGLYLLATMVAGIMVRKYVGKVEHFLVAGREMDVFLGIASLAATEFGIVTCMYTAQAGYTRGFAGATPGICNALAMFLVGYTGFCVKPLRDSGVITIPEMFEKRYGKFVRWLAGVVIVLGGLLNMGVFLRVGGEFLVACCGFDLRYLEITMTVLLLGVAIYTILGGMLSVLVTDFLQFVVMSIGLIAVTFLILAKVKWSVLVDTVETNFGAGGFNPFVNKDLGWQFVLSNLLTNTAAVLTWQTCIARLLAAKDTKTGRKVYTGTAFFFVCRWVIPGIWGIAALAMISPEIVKELGVKIGEEGSLLAMPYYLSTAVPMGMMGILVAAMLAADMSTDSSYMLSWGSVIYNDIMAPFREKNRNLILFVKVVTTILGWIIIYLTLLDPEAKMGGGPRFLLGSMGVLMFLWGLKYKPNDNKAQWTEAQGLLFNRCIVGAIGVFLLIWGLWYKLEGNLWEYLQTTGAIYLASMSILLIACCYWKRANDWGAISGIVIGAALPVASLFVNLHYKVPKLDELGKQVIAAGQPVMEGWAKHVIGDNWVNIGTYAIVAVAMIIGSLIKPRAQAKAS